MEIEAKFHLPHLIHLRKRLLDEGARLLTPRTLERNLRFDTNDGRLVQSHIVLRLRQDSRAALTYKEPQERHEIRIEHEVEVNDFDRMREILDALGYKVIFVYEKYRETFAIESSEVVLDELPFGNFAEVEGPDIEQITSLAERLNLEWERRVALNYIGVFEDLRQRMNLPFRNATFDNFKDYEDLSLDDLGYPFADQAAPSDKDSV